MVSGCRRRSKDIRSQASSRLAWAGQVAGLLLAERRGMSLSNEDNLLRFIF
jgi:hypothetical protein